MPDDEGLVPDYRDWNPEPHALRFERTDRQTVRATRAACHGLVPFVAEMAEADFAKIPFRDIAHRYLTELDGWLSDNGYGGLDLPPGWMNALDPDNAFIHEPPLRWLDIWPAFPDTALDDETPPRLASWRLTRLAAPDGPTIETTVVMVAAEVLSGSTGPQIIGFDFGLRVPMTLTARDGGLTVAIRSMTAELPFPPYRSITEAMALKEKPANETIDPDGTFQSLLPLLDEAIKESDYELSAILHLTDLVYDDFRLRWRDKDGEPDFESLELLGKGIGDAQLYHVPQPYGFSAYYVLAPADGGKKLVPVGGSKSVLASHSDPGMADVFLQDPASFAKPGLGVPPLYDWFSRRPTRREIELQRFRGPSRIGDQELVTLATRDFAVRPCPSFVPEDRRLDPNAPKQVTLPADLWPPVRSNEFSAISAFVNCRKFFRLIAGFGIPLDTFVVAARRELNVFYRSGMGIGRGKRGNTVNARVIIVPTMPVEARFRNGAPPTIEMHLALGNLNRRARRLDAATTPKHAEPLGIAASGPWVWHELGHFLIAARLGQLEFDFAHSAGDGMAAVMADPVSRLSDQRGEVASRFRGITFPWILAARRHDRSVCRGWAWGGALNRSLLDAPAEQREGNKGYVTEQILSSTLFRLYRTLGGDTIKADCSPNLSVRERASFVTLYLLIQAVRSMAQPPSAAEMLELAMEDADVSLSAALPFPSQVALSSLKDETGDRWIGGRAHKVVRWAFEAQGMFAPDPDIDHHGPGKPPPVDIYIPDRRPASETVGGGTVDHRPGGYVPVSLDWDGKRLWQSDPAVLTSFFPTRVKVHNRGDQAAIGVKLRAWLGFAWGDPGAPEWDLKNRIVWIGTYRSVGQGIDVLPDMSEDVEVDVPEANAPAGAGAFWLVLVEVSCPADRANSDPAALLASAITGAPPRCPRQLIDLVANDNNLGLWQL